MLLRRRVRPAGVFSICDAVGLASVKVHARMLCRKVLMQSASSARMQVRVADCFDESNCNSKDSWNVQVAPEVPAIRPRTGISDKASSCTYTQLNSAPEGCPLFSGATQAPFSTGTFQIAPFNFLNGRIVVVELCYSKDGVEGGDPVDIEEVLP